MRNGIVMAIDQDDALAPGYLPANMTGKSAVGEGRRHWIWALIVSTFLTMMGLIVGLANRV